jgi:hypothetical protein
MTMSRKLLFILFTDEPCRRNHALMYALDLTRQGHEVRVLIEGLATRCFHDLEDESSSFPRLFRQAEAQGLVAGACRKASGGCASDDPSRQVAERASARGTPLLDGMDGHASIAAFVRDGYEIVVF